jgi:hypothetical protein
MATALSVRVAERRFYLGTAVVMFAAVVWGFSRTFYLQSWFPEAAAQAAPEPFFFYVHGVSFTAWMLLSVAQPTLISSRRIALHRTVGWFGVGLAAVVSVVGVMAGLIAARRPGGFIGIAIPPLQFLVVPLGDIALFAAFVVLAVVWRRDTQAHKRFMLLATIGLLDAAVVRWPLGDMNATVFGTLWTRTDLVVDLFLVPLVVWDLASRGRLHRVTVIGGAAVIASQPLRMMLSETSAWLRFAEWSVALLG